jgi:hypothetical protein
MALVLIPVLAFIKAPPENPPFTMIPVFNEASSAVAVCYALSPIFNWIWSIYAVSVMVDAP